jgi:hypothetical protein
MAAVGAMSFCACGSSVASPTSTPTSAPTSSPGLLTRRVVVSLDVVARYFPEITVVTRSGANETATGNPVATRSVAFGNGSGAKKVTISVDRFVSTADALSAFREAVAKSRAVAGFTPIIVPNLGRETFAGSVTQGDETHVGLGVLVGTLTVGETLAGFSASSGNVGKLVSLARAEVATAQRALESSQRR